MVEPFVLEQTTSLLRLAEWEGQFPGLVAGFTTRIGGVSTASYTSMNCGLHVGDDIQAVVRNRRNLSSLLQFPFEGWTCADQVHGNHITFVESAQKGRGRDSMEDALAASDGLVTSEKDILLASFYADCVPLLVIDPQKRVIGIAHAGWKGTAAIISQKIVEAITERFDSNRQDIRVAIGPSIGSCCYEVDDRVVDQISVRLVGEKEDWLVSKGQGKYQIDLKLVNYYLFIRAGIQPEHILQSSWCTSCRNDLFFSYRADGGKTGRMAAFLGWRDEV